LLILIRSLLVFFILCCSFFNTSARSRLCL